MGLTHALKFHAATRFAGVLCWAVAGVASISCFNRPLEPMAPTWDSNLSLPLLHRSYTLNELIRKDTNLLHVGPGGQIIYTTSTQVAPTYVGDLITLALKDTTVGVKFGAFAVTVPPIDIPIRFPWLPQGVTIPVPDTTVSVSAVRDTIGSFRSVTFRSGTITLTLRNNLPVPMQVVGPVRLRDSHGYEVASFVFNPGTIPPGGTQAASDDLGGRTLDSVISVTDLSLHTPGSPIPVAIPAGTLFSAQITTADLKARQAVFASIPPQRLSDNDTSRVTVDDSTLIRELHLSAGELRLLFQSHVDLDVRVRYRISEFSRWNGSSYVPYEDSIDVPRLNIDSSSVRLENMKIAAQGPDLLRSMHVISSIVLPSGSIVPVTVSDTNTITINVRRISTIVADSAVGVLKPTWVNLNTVSPVRFGDLGTRFSGQINLAAATLALQTNSTIGFPMDLNLRIGARKSNIGDSVFLYVPASQKRVQNGSDLVVFDPGEVGVFLSQFSSGLPREFRIEGKALVNPPDVYDPSLSGVGSVGSHSSVSGRADMEVPLVMGIISGNYNDTLALGDTTADGHRDYVIDKKEISNVNSGSMTIQVKNSIPVQVGVSFRLLDIGRNSLLRVPQSGVDFTVNAAGVDNEGNVIVPALSTVSFQLSGNEVRQFTPAEYLTVSLSMVTTPGSPAVRFKTTDSVEVRSWTVMRYRIAP